MKLIDCRVKVSPFYSLGYRLGMCAILMVWVCWDCIWGLVAHGNSTIGGRTAFPVFRACGGLVLLHWFWGFSTYMWTRYRINYIFLFDFNPNVVDSPLAIFNDAVDETLVFLISMLLYYKVRKLYGFQLSRKRTFPHLRFSRVPTISRECYHREYTPSCWFFTQSRR